MKQDVLADVLQTLRVDAAEYQQTSLATGQRIAVQDSHAARFYAILGGSVSLQVGLGEPLELQTGDLVLLPHGGAHDLIGMSPPGAASGGGRQAWPAASPARPGNSRASSRRLPELVSGRISFQSANYRHWWELLPNLVFARRQADSVSWLESTLSFVTSEANAQRPGGQTLVSRLTDLLVLHVIRSHLATLDVGSSQGSRWLTALADPQMAAALSLLHHAPAQAWTVRQLARSVGMSRSAFAARFARLVGEPPLHYLTRLRMQKAARLFREGRASTAEVAEQVGYVSDTAFCKAFKRAFGMSPGSFRRAERSDAQAKAA